MKLGVIGGGAWGTALAQVAAADGAPTRLWAREPETVAAINEAHENTAFLPGVALAPAICATGELTHLAECDALLFVTPAQHVRTILRALIATGRSPAPLILCAKGIEAGSGALSTEIAAELAPDWPVAVLSGPSFAHEVARGLPTALTLACAEADLGEALARRLSRPRFRLYASLDPLGAEVGGAVKNVLAIACGVVAGRRLGENARAAVISRGFAEMLRFGIAKGAQPGTLSGLSGLGDLVLTCSSTGSRNYSLGVALGEGRRAVDILAERASVAEGAATAPVLRAAAAALAVEMPICDAVADLIAGAPVDAVVDGLLARPLAAEG